MAVSGDTFPTSTDACSLSIVWWLLDVDSEEELESSPLAPCSFSFSGTKRMTRNHLVVAIIHCVLLIAITTTDAVFVTSINS